MITCKSLLEYLDVITNQIRKHGRDGVKNIEIPKEFKLGISTVDGTWVIRLNTIKAAFITNEWREDTHLNDVYIKCGGKTPIKIITRFSPTELTSKKFSYLVQQAIRKGESPEDPS